MTDLRSRLEAERQAERRRYVLEQAAVANGVLRAVLANRADVAELCDAHVVLGRAVRELCRGQVA